MLHIHDFLQGELLWHFFLSLSSLAHFIFHQLNGFIFTSPRFPSRRCHSKLEEKYFSALRLFVSGIADNDRDTDSQ